MEEGDGDPSLFLNTGCALSINLNLAAVFVHFPRLAAKILGKVFFSSVLRLCFSVVKDLWPFWLGLECYNIQ